MQKFRPLRVAIDGRVLVMKPTGIGRYARSLLRALAVEAGEAFEAVFFTHDRIRDQSFWPFQMNQQVIRFPDPMMFRPFWDQGLLWRAIRKAGPFDLYFSPLSVVPWGLGFPSVATIHDLAFLHYPEIQPWKYRLYWKRAIRKAARRASRLIAVSESTRKDLESFFPGSAKKTSVVYEAPDPQFLQRRKGDRAIDRRIVNLDRYLLAVGTIEPRKNYPFLLEVFRALRARPGCEALRLVIAGGAGWGSTDLEDAMAAMGTSLVRLDYIEFSDLPALYQNALALVFPTIYEGFGLPAVEAMAVGTPVVASNVSSLPEVVGDSGVLLEPGKVGDWVEALERVALDEPWRVRLGSRGQMRSKQFTWERAARETWAIFQEAAGQ